jgi:eukaryotic-like serine/threonine-protein kinase
VADPLDPLIGAIVDGRWQVTERIGQGGMGTVYRGERLKLGKSVALKFLDERFASSKEALARFDREARAISLLQHAHCVSIGDFGVHAGRPFIVMEYVAGRSLGSLMGSKEMTPGRAVNIMRQILDALRHAHAHGVVHRDLKADNVMLAEVTGTADYVKILDFGLARIMRNTEPDISLPSLVAGTPSWMSPEQASGHQVDHRSDLFTAGVMLYTMCTGQKPFNADNPAQLLSQIREARPVRPRKLAPGLSDRLERVIAKAMAKSPEERFESAADFRAALDATPEAKALDRPPTGARVPRPMLGVLTLCLGLGLGGAYLYRQRAARQMERGFSDRVTARSEAHPPPPAPAAPAVAAPTSSPSPPPPEPAVEKAGGDPARGVIEAFISAGNHAAAEQALQALVLKEPRNAWAHLTLGEVYFQRLWRPNAIEAWGEALRLDPDLRHDTRLGDHLCVALGPKWQGGGARLLVSRFGDELVPTLERCILAADDPAQLQAAARTLERAVGRAHVDRGLIALRTLAIAPGCDERQAAVRTLARLREPRAVEPLNRLRGDACLAEMIPPTLAVLPPAPAPQPR